jgi:hypothetical protein
MKDADRLVRNLIMGDVADDYEEFDHVVRNVTVEASEFGVAADRGLVFEKLGELLREGLIQAYEYRPDDRSFVETQDYSSDRVGDLWFYITPRGLQVFEPTHRE